MLLDQSSLSSSPSDQIIMTTVPQSSGEALIRFHPIARFSSKHRRAPRACLRCRSRKVRCDVTHKPECCTNCRLDKVECRVESRKRRCQAGGGQVIHHHAGDGMNEGQTDPDLTGEEDEEFVSQRTPDNLGHDPSGGQSSGQTPTAVVEQPTHSLSTEANYLQSTTTQPDNVLLSVLEAPEPSTQAQLPSQREYQSEPTEHHDPLSSFIPFSTDDRKWTSTLPDFIEPFPVENPDDLEVLRRKSIFVLPPRALQRAIMDRFSYYVHPLLPILDLPAFSSAIGDGQPEQRVSLLLYHAVMFAGVGAMESDTALRLGYMSKMNMRKMFYEKAKILFELDIEKDRVVLCQASLFLVGWASGSDLKNGTFWLGNAISQALSLRLNLPDQGGSNEIIGRSERPIGRILWWCILMKECDLCMYIGQPPRVWPFGTPMLNLNDFDLGSRSAGMVSDEMPHAFGSSPASKLAMACIMKAKLCVQIYRVLRHIHEEILPCSGQTLGAPLVFLRQHMVHELHRWRADVPAELSCKNLLKGNLDASQRSLAWSIAVIELIYWSAHSLICREDLLVGDVLDHINMESISRRGRKNAYNQSYLQRSATETTEILERLVSCKLSEFLPPSSVISISLAVSTLLADVNAADAAIRRTALSKLDVCLKVSKGLADLSPSVRIVVQKMQELKVATLVPRYTRTIASPDSGISAPIGRMRTNDGLEEQGDTGYQSASASSVDISSLGVDDTIPFTEYRAQIRNEWELETLNIAG